MKTLVTLSLLASVLFLQSCGTLLGRSSQPVAVNTVKGAKVYANNVYVGSAPAIFTAKSSTTIIRTEKEGYDDGSAIFQQRFGVGAQIMNALFFLPGVLVDWATNSFYVPTQPDISIDMEKTKTEK